MELEPTQHDNPLAADIHAEKLLVVAAGWRERTKGIRDPYYCDVMLRAAEQLEGAASRAKSPPTGRAVAQRPRKAIAQGDEGFDLENWKARLRAWLSV